MRITVLMENTCEDKRCFTEHGLSLFIETDRHRILFDTGQSSLFAENASALGVDLSEADIAILSHGHYDHSGGLADFLSRNKKATVYMNQNAFVPHYNPAKRKYIGMDPSLKGNPRFCMLGDQMELDEQIKLVTYNERTVFDPIQSCGLTEETDGSQYPDVFRHEQYLILTENDKKVLFSGCSHKGICNLVRWSEEEQIEAVVGGFHFMTLNPEEYGQLDRTADRLLQYPIIYYTCHCTGLSQYRYLKDRMGDALQYIMAGSVIEI